MGDQKKPPARFGQERHLQQELREDGRMWRALYVGAKEALSEQIRQLPGIGPLILGGIAAGESLAGNAAQDAMAQALIARHEELHGRNLQLESEVADLRRALAERSEEADAIEALRRLEAGDTAAAEVLFKGVLDRKRAEGAAANREASAAARHLATLALLHGRGGMDAALAQSAEAVRLAPDDVDAWLLRGLVLWTAGRAGAARDAYRQALDLDPEGRDRAIALTGLGDASFLLGSLPEALDGFERAADLLARRAQAASRDPGNAGWQRDLSVSHDRIGDVRVAQGDLPGALAAYEAGLAIREELASRDPGNAGWQRDLSVSHDRIGNVRTAQGDLPGALESYRASLAIAEELASRDPGNAEWQRDLSVSHDRIGNVRTAQGNLPGALAAYEAGLTIREDLVGRDPGNVGWQRGLSVSHNKVGDVRAALSDRIGALAAYEASQEIFEDLAARDPDNAVWQRDLAVSHNKVGDVRAALSDRIGALAAYEASQEIFEDLAARDPDNAVWQRDLSVSHERIGDVRVAQGSLAEALETYRAGLLIHEDLASRDPGNAEWQRDLMVSNVKLAEVAEVAGDREETARRYRAALEIAKRLSESGRLAPRDAWMVGELEQLLARVGS